MSNEKKKEIQSMGDCVLEGAKCPVVGEGGGISELRQMTVVSKGARGQGSWW